MADRFKQGDTVQLKSGGPVMTVEKYSTYHGERKVNCQYFDKDGKVFSAAFFDDQLKTV